MLTLTIDEYDILLDALDTLADQADEDAGSDAAGPEADRAKAIGALNEKLKTASVGWAAAAKDVGRSYVVVFGQLVAMARTIPCEICDGSGFIHLRVTGREECHSCGGSGRLIA